MRTSKKALLIGVLAAMLPLGVQTVQAATATTNVANPLGASTPIDSLIDLAVNMKSAQLKLSNTDRLVLREQMQIQFRSLPSEKQREIIALTRNMPGEESVMRLVRELNDATRAAAVDAFNNAQATERSGDQNRPQAKLGLSGGDLVFVATAGPCRVADTRVNIVAAWPGPVNGFEGRQIWAFSNGAGYDYNNTQGGTGIAGSGNCAGTVFSGSVTPVSAVVTLTVVDTSTGGALRAWDGTPALTVGGVLAWNAGDRLSNTTVVPLDRSGAQYIPSGPYKRDFAVYNNSGTAINVVADVVGYFIPNQATALDCTIVGSVGTVVAPGTTSFLFSPSCPTGYTTMTPQPSTSGVYGFYTGSLLNSGCRLNNTTGSNQTGFCDAVCCRVPGR